MREPDPRNLSYERPAVAYIEGQGQVFVADVKILDNGWLRAREWSGQTVKVPPHRVGAVRYLEVESYGERRNDGSKPSRIADPDWREQAVERTSDGEMAEVADD